MDDMGDPIDLPLSVAARRWLDGAHHAMPGITRMHNLTLDG